MLCRIGAHFCLLLACYHDLCVWRDHPFLVSLLPDWEQLVLQDSGVWATGKQGYLYAQRKVLSVPREVSGESSHRPFCSLLTWALPLPGTLCWDSSEAVRVSQSYSSSQPWKNYNFLHLYLNGQWAILLALNWTIFCYASESKRKRISSLRDSCFKENF